MRSTTEVSPGIPVVPASVIPGHLLKPGSPVIPKLMSVGLWGQGMFRPMPERPPMCPECVQPLKAGAIVLSRREDDGARACRMLWRCSGRHVWWKWADRRGDPLEVCPHPELFRS
jgi:hypothetical protein